MDKPKVTIYTDGGAEPNPGPGGWGAVLLFEKDGSIRKKELKGGEKQTTNNRMELTAALEALKALNQPCLVELFTDSQYLRTGITEWLAGWKKNNFKKGKVLNSDLWRLLDSEVARHEIQWQWVKGHANHEYNERADILAEAGRAEALGQPLSEDALNNPFRAWLAVSTSLTFEVGVWVASLEKNGQKTLLSGQEEKGAANRLCLLAAIQILESVPEQETVHLFTNNDYLRDGMRGWLRGWKQNNWRTKEGNEVKYRELWEKLDQLIQAHHVKLSSIGDDDPQFAAVKEAAAEMLQKKIKTLD